MTPPRRDPPIRLAFGALFWRIMLGLLGLFAALILLLVSRRVRPGQRAIVFVFGLVNASAVAFAIAAALTVLADLAVRLLIRPRLLSWLSPTSEEAEAHAPFHLDPREPTLAEAPAQMDLGRSWASGRLVRTDRRLLFVPGRWDVEAWSTPLNRLRSTSLSAPPRSFWGLVRGMPPCLLVVDDRDEPRRFALRDPSAWADPHAETR